MNNLSVFIAALAITFIMMSPTQAFRHLHAGPEKTESGKTEVFLSGNVISDGGPDP